MSFFLVFSFFFLFLGGCIYIGRGLWYVLGRQWATKKQTKQNIFSLKWEKKGTVQAYFHLSIQSGLVCNGKKKLKSDIRIKILNDRYRPIDLYVSKKKQTNKQKQKTKNKQKKSCKCQNQWLKREIKPLTNKETNKNKNKQNNNNKKGNDDLKG